jgi:hypothetical protein
MHTTFGIRRSNENISKIGLYDSAPNFGYYFIIELNNVALDATLF